MEVTFTDGTREQYEDVPFKRGAQGELYLSRDKRHVAKLFLLPSNAMTKRIEQVDKIIGPYNVVGTDPYWNECFGWPDKRSVSPRPGVRMRNIPLTRMDEYFWRTASQRMDPERRGWWIGRVACAIKLARAVTRLHTRGLCHSDLSDKNVMVDPFSGELTILDCDSLVVPGELPHDVFGTPGYMAPEIVTNKATPIIQTDLHALAVLLYRWLLYRHPLMGPKQHAIDADQDDFLMLGARALYIEHPTDQSNRPQKMQLTAAGVLTPRVAELFRQAFVDGLHMPFNRPTASRWEAALLEMYDAIVPCPNGNCEMRFFIAHDAQPLQCPLCHSFADIPDKVPFLKLQSPRIDHGNLTHGNDGRHPHYVVGWPERPLYAWHADPKANPFPDPSGKVDTAPQAMLHYDAVRREWYLENIKLPNMRIAIGAGQRQWGSVPMNQMVQLHHNDQIFLGEENSARKVFVELRRVR